MESAALPAAQSAAQRAPGRRRLSDRARAERKTAYMLCAPAVVVITARREAELHDHYSALRLTDVGCLMGSELNDATRPHISPAPRRAFE